MDRATARRILGVPPGADRRAVDAAFRQHARAHHPDVGGDAGRFDEVVCARATLIETGAALETGAAASPIRVVPDPRPWDRLVATVRRWRRPPPPRVR